MFAFFKTIYLKIVKFFNFKITGSIHWNNKIKRTTTTFIQRTVSRGGLALNLGPGPILQERAPKINNKFTGISKVVCCITFYSGLNIVSLVPRVAGQDTYGELKRPFPQLAYRSSLTRLAPPGRVP